MAQQADEFIDWGTRPKARDRQLRAFLPTENGLVSAQSITAARNAALSWKLTGGEQTIEAMHDMIANANYGAGWEDFVIRVSHDLYSQDEGAFVELIREDPNRADSPVVGFAHLDAARCYQTGNLEKPVVFEDVNSKMHVMPWHNVVHLLEMPAPLSSAGPAYCLQYSAVTRALRAAQVLRSIAMYKDEKASGRFMRGIHLLSGVSEASVRDALARANMTADQQGLTRYMQPAFVAAVDPKQAIGHAQIDLASLPEGWDEGESYRIYIMVLAMAYLTDYQEFAPLPGGNLGTSQQSQTLHLKSKGKGPGLFQKLIVRLMNGYVLPSNVLFEFDEPDVDARMQEDEAAKLRAEARATRVQSGELDVIAAQQLAFEEGDLPAAIYEEMVARQEAERRAAEEAAQQAAQQQADQPEDMLPGEGDQPTQRDQMQGEDNDAEAAPAAGRREAVAVDDGYDPEEYGLFDTRAQDEPPSPSDRSRLEYEEQAGDEIARGLARAQRIVRRRLNATEDD